MLAVWARRQGLLLSVCAKPTLYLSFGFSGGASAKAGRERDAETGGGDESADKDISASCEHIRFLLNGALAALRRVATAFPPFVTRARDEERRLNARLLACNPDGAG